MQFAWTTTESRSSAAVPRLAGRASGVLT